MKRTEIEKIVNFSGGLRSHPKWLRRKIIEIARNSMHFKTMNLYKFKTFGEFNKAFKQRFGFKP